MARSDFTLTFMAMFGASVVCTVHCSVEDITVNVLVCPQADHELMKHLWLCHNMDEPLYFIKGP